VIGRIRNIIFLKDVLLVSLSAFGGAPAHFTLFLKFFVDKRGYLSEKELIELNALCNLLPGPTSTQTIISIGFRLGGPKLAYLTLLVWMLPAFLVMTTAGIIMSLFYRKGFSIDFTKYIQPMAVGFICYAAYKIARAQVTTKTALAIMIGSAAVSILYNVPWIFPILLLISGSITTYKFRKQPKQDKGSFTIRPENLMLWLGVFVFSVFLGAVTGYLPFRLFENFYRTGSIVFGGGHILVPLMYSEFVELKNYLSTEEFLAGLAFTQAVPGPVFSFCAYVGALSMRDYGIGGEILGAVLASAGIFLPGTFLVFFLSKFWESLKPYRIIRASLEGITACSAGLVIGAAYILFKPIEFNVINILFVAGTFLLLFTRIPPPLLIVAGLLAGFIF
jgi:chromate transporter